MAELCCSRVGRWDNKKEAVALLLAFRQGVNFNLTEISETCEQGSELGRAQRVSPIPCGGKVSGLYQFLLWSTTTGQVTSKLDNVLTLSYKGN